MADTSHSKCDAARRAGSSPASGIHAKKIQLLLYLFVFQSSYDWSCMVTSYTYAQVVEWQTRRTQNAMPQGVPVQVRPWVSNAQC